MLECSLIMKRVSVFNLKFFDFGLVTSIKDYDWNCIRCLSIRLFVTAEQADDKLWLWAINIGMRVILGLECIVGSTVVQIMAHTANNEC